MQISANWKLSLALIVLLNKVNSYILDPQVLRDIDDPGGPGCPSATQNRTEVQPFADVLCACHKTLFSVFHNHYSRLSTSCTSIHDIWMSNLSNWVPCPKFVSKIFFFAYIVFYVWRSKVYRFF